MIDPNDTQPMRMVYTRIPYRNFTRMGNWFVPLLLATVVVAAIVMLVMR